MEWPKGSGNNFEGPEVDEYKYFTIEGAKDVMVIKQREFIDRLLILLKEDGIIKW